MRDRSLGGSLGVGALVAAAIYALVPHAATQPQASTTGLPDSTRAKAEDPESSGPLSLLKQFLGKGADSNEPAVECGPYMVHFVIATLPDPVDSHFASGFDRGLEAIVAAMFDAGYDIDSWSLPWRIPGPTELQAVWATDESGKPKLTEGPAIAKMHRTQPGVVLFRKEKDLRVLFLVGETPTKGLQKEAFVQALKAVNEFEADHPNCVPSSASPLPVLAPYFSGTSESLHIVLSSQTLLLSVRLLSGSATSNRNPTVLGLSGKSSYKATIHTDKALMTALYEYFGSIGVTPSADVALLVEEGTAYGQDFAEFSPDLRPKLVMKFPLQISQIRSAYEKLEAAKRGTVAAPQVHRALEISLEGPERPKDVLSPYDSRMTANAAELVLANVFDTVRRQRIGYLGLVASDTRDVLFLARKAREYGTDAHLFTFGSDVLYQHPDVLPSLNGLLVVTTYPLLGAYQAWHAAGFHRRSFSGSSEEGIYNAMLFLIDQKDASALDYASPFDNDERPPVWIVANGRHGFWPVWVSPPSAEEAQLLPKGKGGGREKKSHGWPALPIPNGTLVLFFAWSTAALLFILGHRDYRPVTSKENGKRESAPPVESPGAGTMRDRLRTFFSDCAGQSHVFMNYAAMAGISFVLAVIEGSLATQLIGWSLIGDRGWFEIVGLGLIGFFGLVFTARIFIVEVRDLFLARRDLLRARRSMRREEGDPLNESTTDVRWAFVFNLAALGSFAAFGGLVAFFTASIFFTGSIAMAPQEQTFLLLNRSFELGSRVGPLLPLCLGSLVLVLFAMCQVRRSILYEEQCFPPPEGKPPQTLGVLLEPYIAFTRMIRNPWTSLLPSMAPLAGLLAFYALFVGGGWYHSFDGRAWGALSTLLLLFCGWCVAWSVLEFRAIWRRLSALLRILSWSPLADAFNRMPDGLAKSQWRMWRAPPTLTSLHVSVSHLKTLVSLDKGNPPGGPRLSQEVVEAQQKADGVFNAVLARAHHGHASTQDQRKKLRTHLACATMGVCRMLEREWGSWPSKADIADKSDKDQEALNTIVWLRRQVPKPPDVFVRIAEEYVAVRFVSFIHYAFSHMRNVLSFALAGFVLLMALIGSYPFQPLHPVVGIAWILGLLGIAGVLWTFIDMDRDLILSYIAKTTPGRVNFNLEFTTNLLLYGLVPLLTLLATQFPEIGDWILSLLNPAMRTR